MSRPRFSLFLLLGVLLALTGLLAPGAQAVTLSPVTGSGSTYVGIAMRQWVAQGQSQGWKINYSPVGSPTGLSMYGNSQVDFAGTEAEFTSVGSPDPGRGYQYVPDVAGATAIMYNITESSGKKVDYLHLDRKTVARIFMGEITNWDDPAISKTNKGIKFPNQKIRVVLRGNQSGTTALFYDFIANTLGSEYTRRFTQWQCGSASIRPVQIQCRKGAMIPDTVSFNDSDQIAQYVGNKSGKWSIAFDEFGYAKVYHVPTAWIQNASGHYVLPYAQNISAALQSAELRPDLSQELSGVYASRNKQTYPISAYSYIVSQCATAGDRATCAGGYSDAGVGNTLGRWMSYIACDGQVTMAAQGYSPLPPNLSQEMANSVGRLTGAKAVRLTAKNCANPRFKGSLGAGATSPCDPFTCGAAAGSSSGGGSSAGGGPSGSSSSSSGSTSGTATSAGGSAGSKTGSTATAAAAGGNGTVQAEALGGSDASTWRDAQPTSFDAVVPDDPFGSLPALLVFGLATLPALVMMAARGGRRKRAADGDGSEG